MICNTHAKPPLHSVVTGWLYVALKGALSLIVIICALSFLFTGGQLQNKNADPSVPPTKKAPITMSSGVVKTEADYLLVYNNFASALGVYDENGAFLCSYRIPNIDEGTTAIHVAFGELYIHQNRSHDTYRYGARGEYLGRIQGPGENDFGSCRIYDARGNCTGTYDYREGDVVAFTAHEIYWMADGEYFLQQDAYGELVPIAPVEISYTAEDCYIIGTTLVNSDGIAIDSSPWYERFRSINPIAGVFLAVICTAIRSLLNRIAAKLEKHGHLTTEPWQRIYASAKRKLLHMREQGAAAWKRRTSKI